MVKKAFIQKGTFPAKAHRSLFAAKDRLVSYDAMLQYTTSTSL